MTELQDLIQKIDVLDVKPGQILFVRVSESASEQKILDIASAFKPIEERCKVVVVIDRSGVIEGYSAVEAHDSGNGRAHE